MYLILKTTLLVNMIPKHIPHLYQHTARPIADKVPLPEKVGKNQTFAALI